MKAHPAADLFPMLTDAAMRELTRDIEANGLRDPICIWGGVIVDGRNRFVACSKTMHAPVYREMEFVDDAECIRYIISTNIHRRHLTESQRAMIASELANLKHGGDRKSDQAANLPLVSQREASEQMQVSERSVRAAKAVQRDAPDLAAKVKSGELKVSKAAAMARERTKPTSRAQPDPDRAADSIQDIQDEMDADGATPLARDVLAKLAKCSATEKTWMRSDVLLMFGVRELSS